MPRRPRGFPLPGSGRVPRIRTYTRNVVSWARRLVGIAAALAVSGSPAVLAVCMTLCVPAGPAAATPMEHGPAAAHATHEPVAAAPSGHAHHAAPPAHDMSGHRASPPDSSSARLTASCGTCCDEAGVAVMPGVVVDRTAALKVAAAPIATSVLSVRTITLMRVVSPPDVTVPPPPTRAPLVLRI